MRNHAWTFVSRAVRTGFRTGRPNKQNGRPSAELWLVAISEASCAPLHNPRCATLKSIQWLARSWVPACSFLAFGFFCKDALGGDTDLLDPFTRSTRRDWVLQRAALLSFRRDPLRPPETGQSQEQRTWQPTWVHKTLPGTSRKVLRGCKSAARGPHHSGGVAPGSNGSNPREVDISYTRTFCHVGRLLEKDHDVTCRPCHPIRMSWMFDGQLLSQSVNTGLQSFPHI